MNWERPKADSKNPEIENKVEPGETRKNKIIIRFGNQSTVFNLEPQLGLTPDQLQQKQIILFIKQKWGLNPDDYYLDIPHKTELLTTACRIVNVQPRIRGGGAANAFFKVVLSGITAIFNPIIKPLIAIANAFLMLIKAIAYVIMLFYWFLKFLGWIFTEVLPSIPTDIFGLVRFLAAMLIDAVVGTFMYYFRKLFNSAGSTVIGAALTGWDNNPDETPQQANENASKFEDSKKKIGEDTNTGNQQECEGRKCYRTEAGTVPWTVILATVLFPPAGVFMELGLTGWLQILVCLLLTFMFYFPGLIYALILLYC